MDILVSIDCTTYNHEKYIADAIESFIMQKTNFNFEILIHDDASTDRTAEIIKGYAEKYPNIIKPILQKENQYSKGVKRINYKLNIKRAKGKYIAMCEGDDYWTDPFKLQKQVDYLENHPNCSMCFHSSQIINGRNEAKAIMRSYNHDTISPIEDIILGGGGFCPTQSIVYRKSSMDNPPDFYFNAPIGDYPLQIFLATQGYVYYMDEVMSVYRKVMKSESWTSRNKGIEVNKQLCNKIINMLEQFDEYSEFKFTNAVTRAKFLNNFSILIYDKNLRGLRKGEYRNYLDKLKTGEKLKVYLRCLFPKLYIRILEVKYK